jgi:uncharacterized membrane protein
MNIVEKKAITKRYQKIALLGYIGLLILMPVWLIWLEPTEGYSIGFVFILYILPLLLPLKGIIQDKPFTYAWANFVVIIYFLHGFTLLWIGENNLLYVVLELIFSSLMFIGCTYYARHRGQELGLTIRKLKEDLADEKASFEKEDE